MEGRIFFSPMRIDIICICYCRKVKRLKAKNPSLPLHDPQLNTSLMFSKIIVIVPVGG